MTFNPMKISGRQVFWLLITVETGSMELLALRPTIEVAKQDAWISMLGGGIIGIFMTFVVVRLSLLYPNQSMTEYVQTILGTWFGRLFLVPYLVMGIFGTGLILRQFTGFVHLAFFNSTPIWILIFCFVVLMLYMTFSGGIEGIARCAELIGPMAVFAVALVKLFNLPNYDLHLALPVYADSGWMQILKGSVLSGTFFGQSIVMAMLVSFMTNPVEEAESKSLWAIVVSTVLMAASSFLIVIIFGPTVSARMLYPAFESTRFISVLEFVQNIDSIVVVIWTMAYFVEMSLYFFITSYALENWLRIRERRWTIGFSGICVFIVAIYPEGSNFVLESVIHSNWSIVLLYINMLVIPMFLWVIGGVRKRMMSKSGSPQVQEGRG